MHRIFPTVATPDDTRLRDEEAQLARVEASRGPGRAGGETGLVAKLTVLRHVQQGRVIKARRRVGDRSSFREFLEGMRERIVAMGFGGAH